MLCGLFQTAQASAEYRIEPTPAWVIPVERGRADETLLKQASGGVHYLLTDSQVRMDGGAGRTRYHRLARQVLTPEGLQQAANVTIAFEPTYQTLVLHAIDIVRDGVIIPKLADATVQVLQRETELERRIYDGSKTATIFLEDVRTGDIIDYAYSIRGSNPVFAGRDFGRLLLRFDIPVGRVHVRMVTPADSPISVLPHGDAPGTELDESGSRAYRWLLDDVPAEVQEADRPDWYDATPSVQWSAYADWNAVARWAQPLYAVPASIGADLRAEIDRIAAAEPTPQGRLLAALRFVQGEIRYLGIAIGSASHAPTSPDRVLKRRFGDCKDKTLLLLTLLDGLGIDGRAALVSTELGRGVEDRQPSPGAFDHVVAQVRIGPSTYWLDSTRQPQLADLQHLTQADFGLALLIDPQTRALLPMAQPDAIAPAREVRLSYDATAGFQAPVALTVTTAASGERADSLRNAVSSSNIEELQKSYLNFYANSYPGITMSAPIEVRDEPLGNRIVVTEHYAIADFTAWSDADQRYTATFSAPDMLDVLHVPAVAARVSPIGLAHPTDLTVITDVRLPEAWPVEADRTLIEDPAFVYERTIEPGDKRFSVTDRYRTRADSVPAADAVRYAGNLARARDHTAYSLHWTDPERSAAAGLLDRINWLILILGAMTLASWIWLAARAWRVDHPPLGPVSASAPIGLGGWLALPTIGTVVSPFLVAFGLYGSATVWTPATWSALTTYGNEAYHPLWAPVLLIELIGTLGLMVFWALTCVLFLQRRSSAPIWYIRVMIASAVYAVLDLGLMALLPTVTIETKDISDCVRQIVTAAIWTAYFLKSERVRATFVRRLRPTPPDTPNEAPVVQVA